MVASIMLPTEEIAMAVLLLAFFFSISPVCEGIWFRVEGLH